MKHEHNSTIEAQCKNMRTEKHPSFRYSKPMRTLHTKIQHTDHIDGELVLPFQIREKVAFALPSPQARILPYSRCVVASCAMAI